MTFGAYVADREALCSLWKSLQNHSAGRYLFFFFYFSEKFLASYWAPAMPDNVTLGDPAI